MDHLLDLAPSMFRDWLAQNGLASYRAEQIRRWIFQKRAVDFSAMSDLPKSLRGRLVRRYVLWTTRVARHDRSEDGTEKLLLALHEEGGVECVLLREAQRRTICISTQVGCGMGCVFCASGLDGVERNLTSGEIVEQMLRLQQLLPREERISHIVVMGMGEPLANLDRLLPALDNACREDGLGVSARRITISTVGLPGGIERLASQRPRYHLAVSLHAPSDPLRSRLVPANRRTGLNKILAASDRYFEASGRRLTFEYVLLADVNDRPEHARQLADLLRGRPALLNLIPYNPVPGRPYRTSSASSARRFCDILERRGVRVQLRRRKGCGIEAACGQLRRRGSREAPANRSACAPALRPPP